MNRETHSLGNNMSVKPKENGVNYDQRTVLVTGNENIKGYFRGTGLLPQIGKSRVKARKVVQVTIYFDEFTLQTFFRIEPVIFRLYPLISHISLSLPLHLGSKKGDDAKGLILCSSHNIFLFGDYYSRFSFYSIPWTAKIIVSAVNFLIDRWTDSIMSVFKVKDPCENRVIRMVPQYMSVKPKENGVNYDQKTVLDTGNENINGYLCGTGLLPQIGESRVKTRKVVQVTIYFDESTLQTFFRIDLTGGIQVLSLIPLESSKNNPCENRETRSLGNNMSVKPKENGVNY
ncbi:MAG: hypothetical protein HDR88_09270, partial [Bacteroides sp.]|nr:hypothetical protein [Bacteroides sp.]